MILSVRFVLLIFIVQSFHKMRPRINTFGKITRKELDKYLTENQVYGFTVNINENEITLTRKNDNFKNLQNLGAKLSALNPIAF